MAITYHAGKRIQGTSTDATAVQGYAGGNTPNPSGTGSGAGGGGAGGLGATPTNNVGGAGGVGSSSDIETPPVQSTDGSYTVLQFTGDATFTPSSSFNVEYLVVGGGGGGGSGSYSGGGGAGAYRTATGFGVTAQTYNITIGAGGSGRLGDSVTGGVGGSSVFSTITSVGGAGGASGHATSGASSSGASGGGGAVGGGSGGGSGSYGNNGGSGYSWGAPYLTGGGGGGGSGAAGSNGSSGSGGAGGTGTANDILISSTNIYYAGGGGGVAGGNNSSNQAGAGGNGGGGQGGKITSPSEAGRSATPNTGGGGGGGSYWAGGDGGSGVVIIRFLTSGNSYTITDGIGSVYYAGGGGGGGNSGVGAGGQGGGGQGATGSADGKDAGGYGSGGGGGAHASGNGGSGSDGIVIIRFTTSGNGYSQAGGTVDSSTVSGQTIISWTATSGTRTFTPTSTFDVQYLIIAGGGGGGSYYWAGGGGGGGYLTGTDKEVTAQAYTIVVGAGGAVQSTANTNGNNGSNSSALGLTAIGGGAGATDNGTANNGGSGGGAGGGGNGVRGEGTSTDTKPTNVQLGSRWEETDTRKIYYYGDSATYETDFSSSTGWVSTDSKFVVNRGQDAIIASTGTYSSDVTTCSGDNDRNGFMVNSTSSAVYGKTINSVSFYLKKTGSPTGTAYVRVWSGSNSGSGTQVHEFGTIDVSTLTTSYVKYTFNTGSHTLAVNDTVGLQYSGSTSNAPVMQGATSDVYDGTNTIRNRFTSGAFSPVTSHDIKFEIDKGQDAIIADNDLTTDNLQVGYDLTSISDTSWVIDFDLKIVSNTSGGSLWTQIGMFSVDTSVIDDSNQDFLGLILHAQDSQGVNSDAILLSSADNSSIGNAQILTFGENGLNGTPQFYLRMKRTASNKLTLENYSSSARTGTPSTTVTMTLSGDPQSLQYFKVSNRTVSGTGTLNIKIENLTIWDNYISKPADTVWKELGT